MPAGLLYRGPTLDELHERWAKAGRVDTDAPVRARSEVVVAAGPDRVWAVLADAARWSTIDPAIHDVELSDGVRVDAPFTWRNGRSRIRSRFAVVEPGHELTWTGTSAGARAVHRHVLTATEDGGTRLLTEESMAAPLLALLYPSRKLEVGLASWAGAIKAAVEGAPR